MSRWTALGVALAFAAALGLRLAHLEIRPLHNDEAVNAIKLRDLWQQGRYAYDPDEYHGPALLYASLPFVALSGSRNPEEWSESALRLTPAVFGAGLVLLTVLLADGLGCSAVAWAALLIALSPAMVFYSRYYIHEMLLVFSTASVLGASWRYVQRPSFLWAALIGGGLGLMITTKETFVLSLGAMGIAGVVTLWWNGRNGASVRRLSTWWNARHAALMATVALLFWLVLFSSFFTHWPGLLDSVRTYLPWLKRAGGHSPHLHPWPFYFELLTWFHPVKGPIWTEAVVVALALWGAVASMFLKRTPQHRFLAIYTLVLAAVYSAISYKTPWCLLNFYLGMILLAGVGAAALVDLFPSRSSRGAVYAVLFLSVAHLGWQAWRASVVYPTDRRNPYVYAQTVPDVLNLVHRIESVAAVASTRFETVVKVIAPLSDYWPLPWYLRRFKHLGWYEQLPEDPFAPLVLVASKLDARLDERSEKKWLMVGLSELRPGKFFELYVELELWKKYVETLPREVE